VAHRQWVQMGTLLRLCGWGFMPCTVMLGSLHTAYQLAVFLKVYDVLQQML
jgi:hypothetical protein